MESMTDDHARRSSLGEIKRMRAKGLTKTTPADAPEIELDKDFWRNAVDRGNRGAAQNIRASAR